MKTDKGITRHRHKGAIHPSTVAVSIKFPRIVCGTILSCERGINKPKYFEDHPLCLYGLSL